MTEVGNRRELPRGWSWYALGEVAETSSGGTPSRSRPDYYQGGSIPWLKIRDLNDSLVVESEEMITPLGLKESAASVLPPGTILLAMYGSIGKLGVLGIEAATNQAICAIRPDEDIVSRQYLYWYFLAVRPSLLALGRGGTQSNISQRVLKSFPIAIPLRSEQDRIAGRIDALIAQLKGGDSALSSAIDNCNLLRRSIHARVGRQGEKATLGELVSKIEAGRSFRCEERPAGQDEWGVVKVSALTWGAFREDQNKTITELDRVDPRWEISSGDLLVSRANTSEYVGAAVLVGSCRSKLLLSDKSLRLVPKQGIDPEWLLLALQSPAVRGQISRSATGTSDSMRNLSQDKLRAIKIRIPSLDKQLDEAAGANASLDRVRSLEKVLEDESKMGTYLVRSTLNAGIEGAL
jgi:type I restriction enzyme S subunit